MKSEELKEKILKWIPNAEITEGKQFLTFIVPASKIHLLGKNLKESEDTAFDYLFCQTAVDMTDHMLVVYHLLSTKHKHEIVVKVKTSGRENPVVETVSDIWRAAEYYEREIFDLFGIKFSNHPDLRRIFLDDSWGHPLRKDYKDEINIVER